MDSSSALKLNIVSPEKILYNGLAGQITLPGVMGTFTVLPLHAPLISSLEQGKIVYSHNGINECVEIKSGFVEIKDNIVDVCVEQI